MKSRGLIITLIMFFVALIIALIFLMFKLLNGNFMFLFGHNVSNNKILEETYEVMNIDIDGKAADIHIKENSEEKIKVIVYSEQEKTDVKVNGDKLEIISNTKSCKGFCFSSKYDKIEVYVPTTYMNNINIKEDAGDIDVGKFDNLVLDIDTDAGDIDIDSAKDVNIKTNAGDIDIGSINSIIIKADAGDIKINKVNEYLNIETDAGDIKIKNANIIKNSKINADAGDIKIENTNDIYIEAKTSAGDTKINNSNRKSDIELTIKTSAGDIRVN